MQLLLSNPSRRKRRKSRTKSKRRRANRRVFRRRRRTKAAVSARRVPTMARKTTRRRRRSYRRTTKRRGYSGGGRRGFIDKALLLTGAGVAGGLIAAPYISRYLPATWSSNPFVGPAVKAGAGLAVAAFGKRFNGPLSSAIAAGLIGSAVLDLAVAFRGTAGSALPTTVKGYEGSIVGYELGDYQLEDGSLVSGYLTDQGEVVDPAGSVVGEVDLADGADDTY